MPARATLRRRIAVAGALLLATSCRMEQLLQHPEGALLCVAPTAPDTLADSAALGSTAKRSDAISIRNCGGGALRWTAYVESGSPWVTLEPDSGSVEFGDGAPHVRFDPAGLPEGSYRGGIVVNSAGGTGVAEVPVRFSIHPCPVAPIALGDSVAARLTAADCGAPHRDGRFARLYGFPGTADDSVSIAVAATFEAYLALDTALDASRAPLAETGACVGAPGDPCLRYQRLPRNSLYYVEVTSATAADSGAFTLRLTHPRVPFAPNALDQRLADSTTSVAPGGVIPQAGILLRAVVTDPDPGDSLRLEAEVRPVDESFTGPNVPPGPAVASGQVAWLQVIGLDDNTAYHWRVRAADQTGRAGSWAAPGGEPDFAVSVPNPPGAPAALAQATLDGSGILTGTTIDTDVVILSGVVSDADPGDAVRLEFEVRPVGTAFTAASDSSPAEPDGGQLQATVGPLGGGTAYHWRARAVDREGGASAWVSYGGNAENATDFAVAAAGYPDRRSHWRRPRVPTGRSYRWAGSPSPIRSR